MCAFALCTIWPRAGADLPSENCHSAYCEFNKNTIIHHHLPRQPLIQPRIGHRNQRRHKALQLPLNRSLTHVQTDSTDMCTDLCQTFQPHTPETVAKLNEHAPLCVWATFGTRQYFIVDHKQRVTPNREKANVCVCVCVSESTRVVKLFDCVPDSHVLTFTCTRA